MYIPSLHGNLRQVYLNGDLVDTLSRSSPHPIALPASQESTAELRVLVRPPALTMQGLPCLQKCTSALNTCHCTSITPFASIARQISALDPHPPPRAALRGLRPPGHASANKQSWGLQQCWLHLGLL